MPRVATIRSARSPIHGHASYLEVLDHVLDKGIVIGPRSRLARVGIDLLTTPARIVVTSIETHLPRATTGPTLPGAA